MTKLSLFKIYDELIIDAAWDDIKYYLKDNKFHVRFSENGIIRYEERYNPPVTVRFKELICYIFAS